MRSMNKYGVILIVGTIGSVFACCNCSTERNKESQELKNFKRLICECFNIKEKDIIFTWTYDFNMCDWKTLKWKTQQKQQEYNKFKKEKSKTKYIIKRKICNKVWYALVTTEESKTLIHNNDKIYKFPACYKNMKIPNFKEDGKFIIYEKNIKTGKFKLFGWYDFIPKSLILE